MDKLTPQETYQNKLVDGKKNRRTFILACFWSTEDDIIKKLESEKSYAAYIKNLIRHDLKKNQNI